MSTSFEEYKAEQMKDPEFRAAYENPPLSEVIANAVFRRRQELGITQTELAKARRTSQTQLWRIESGEYNPTLKTVGALGIELSSLLRGGEPSGYTS